MNQTSLNTTSFENEGFVKPRYKTFAQISISSSSATFVKTLGISDYTKYSVSELGFNLRIYEAKWNVSGTQYSDCHTNNGWSTSLSHLANPCRAEATIDKIGLSGTSILLTHTSQDVENKRNEYCYKRLLSNTFSYEVRRIFSVNSKEMPFSLRVFTFLTILNSVNDLLYESL